MTESEPDLPKKESSNKVSAHPEAGGRQTTREAADQTGRILLADAHTGQDFRKLMERVSDASPGAQEKPGKNGEGQRKPSERSDKHEGAADSAKHSGAAVAIDQSPQYKLAEKLLGKDLAGLLPPGEKGTPPLQGKPDSYVRDYFLHQAQGDGPGAHEAMRKLAAEAETGNPQTRHQLQALQLVDAVSTLQSGVTGNNMVESQKGLRELAKLEGSVSTAGFILDRFPESTGNTRSNLREAQVNWARIGAKGSDAAVLEAAHQSQQQFIAAGADNPANRTTALIDLTLAHHTLTPEGRKAFDPAYRSLQAVDMVANLKDCLGKPNGNGHHNAGSDDGLNPTRLTLALDMGLKLSQSGNQPAKDCLEKIGVRSPSDITKLVSGLGANGANGEAVNNLRTTLDGLFKGNGNGRTAEDFSPTVKHAVETTPTPADSLAKLFGEKGKEAMTRPENLEQVQKAVKDAFKTNGWQGVDDAVKQTNEKLQGTAFALTASAAPFAHDTVRLTVENKENGLVRTNSFSLREQAHPQLEKESKEQICSAADGSFVASNSDGLPTRTRDAGGNARAFLWDGKDLIGMKDPDGSQWLKANKEGNQWRNPETGETRRGKIDVAGDGTLTVTKADHSSTSFKTDGSEVRRNEQGYVTSVADKFGRESQYDNFDKNGRPQWIKEHTGTVWNKTGDKDGVQHWVSSANREWNGKTTLDHATGVRTEEGKSGYTRVRTTDGVDKIIDHGKVSFQQENTNGSMLYKDAQNRPSELHNQFGAHKFELDQNGQVQGVQAPLAQLKRVDDNTWSITQNGKTETMKGHFEQAADGSYGIVGDNKAVFAVRSDGGIIGANSEGKINETVAPNGKGHRIAWDAQGVSALTDSAGDTYTRQQDGSYKTADGKKTLDGLPVVTPDGTVAIASKNRQTIYTTDGRVLTRDADGHKVRLESANGEIFTYQKDDKGQDVPKEYERADHSKLAFDQAGHIVATTDVYGQKRSIELKDGKVVGFQDETGKYERGPEAEKGKSQVWFRAGTRDPIYGGASIQADGSFVKTDDIHSTNTSFRPDGMRDVVTEVKRTADDKPVYAYRLENNRGSIVEQTPAGSTQPFKFEYMPGTPWLKSVEIPREGSPPLTVTADQNGLWKGTDGNSYLLPTLNTRDGTLTLRSASDYTTTFYKANGDHVQVPAERAEKLYESLRQSMYDVHFYVSDSAVLGAMENAATPEDLKVVNRMFSDRKKLSLDGHLNNDHYMSNDSRRDKAMAMLNYEDGPQNRAGEIKTIIGELEKGGGRWRSEAETSLRQLFSGMSSKDIMMAQEKYQRDYHTEQTFFSLLVQRKADGDFTLSPATKDIVEFNLRGKENQDAFTQSVKMNTAVQHTDSRMFNEVAAATPDTIRDDWMRQGGSERLQEQFQGKWRHAFTLGLTGNFTNSELNLVNSYAKWGEAGADTLVAANTSVLGDNEEAIKHSLDTMSDKQRAAYSLGMQVGKGTAGSPKNDEERTKQAEALKYYKSLDGAMVAAAGKWFSPNSQVAELNDWRDRILIKGGGFASELAPHMGCVYDSDRKDIVASMRSMTQEQWKQLKQDPEAQKRATEILGRFDYRTKHAVTGMFADMMCANSYADAMESGKPSVLVNIDDARNSFSRNDYQHVYDAISNMKQPERVNYATNEKFRSLVDSAVDSAIGTEQGRQAAHSLLKQVQDSGGKQSQWGLVEQLQAYNGNGQFPQTQKLVRELKTEIDKPGVKERLLDANSDLRKQFDTLMESAVPNDRWRQQIVDGLLSKNGTVPLDLELQIGRSHADSSGMLKDIQAAPKSERDRLLSDDSAFHRAFGYPNKDQETLARQLLSQEGQMRPEDKLRAYVLGSGVSKEEAVEATRGLSEAKRGDVINSYIKKYDGNLLEDLRGEMDLESFRTARDSLIYGARTSYEAQDRALNRFSGSSDSIGARVNRGFGWDGTPQGLDNVMFRFSGELARGGQDGKPMSLDQAREHYQAVVTAAKHVDQSSAQMADVGSDAVITVAAIGGSFVTGGASLSLLALTTAGGALTKVGAKSLFLGNNYDSHEIVADSLKGGFSGALNLVGGGEIAFGLGLGKAGAVRAAELVTAGAGKEALAITQAQLAKELEKTVAHAIAANSSHVAPKALEKLVENVAAKGISETDKAVLRTALEQSLKKGIEETAPAAMASYARSVALSGMAGAGGGGTGAFGASLADADWKRNGFSDNLVEAAQAGILNAPGGALMAVGGHVGLQAAGHGFNSGRQAVKWAAGHTADGVKWSYNKAAGSWQAEHASPVEAVSAGKPGAAAKPATVAEAAVVRAEKLPEHATTGGSQLEHPVRQESLKPTGEATSGRPGLRPDASGSEEVYRPQIPKPTEAELQALNQKIPSLNKEAAEDFSRRLTAVREGWKEDLSPAVARAKELADQIKVASPGEQTRVLTQEHAELTRRLDDVAKSRQAQLQKTVDDFVADQTAKGHNLPKVTIATAGNMHAAGGYDWGAGVITVPREDLLAAQGGKGLSKTVFHEAVHAEQDLLLVRNSIRETTAGGAPLDPTKVQSHYQNSTGRELSNSFLDQVVEQSKGKPQMNAADVARAQELAKAVKDSSPVAERSMELGNTARVIDSTRRNFDFTPDGQGAERIFQKLNQPDGDVLAQRLFADKPVPNDIMRQFQKWQALPTDPVTGDKIGFQPQEANQALAEHLKARLTEVNAEHKALIDKYANSAIEKDARLEHQVKEPGAPAAFDPAVPKDKPPSTPDEILHAERERIQQLEAITKPKPERIQELAYLTDQHAHNVKQSARHLRDLERRLESLEIKREKQPLSAQEQTRYEDGMAERKRLTTELRAEREAQIERLVNEAPKSTDQGGVTGRQKAGGDFTQGIIFKQLRKEMDVPLKSLGGQTLREAGYELVAIKSGTAFDAIGGDYALINKRNGEFIPLDASQRVKTDLPKLRQDNVITSDPNDPKLLKFGEGSLDYNKARAADIHNQFDQIVGRMRKQGSPLNVLETPIPTNGPHEGYGSNLGDKERLAKIDAIRNPTEREVELRQCRESAQAKGKELDQLINDMKDRARELRKSGDADDAKGAQLLEEYAGHSERGAKVYNQKLIKNDLAPREAAAGKAARPNDAGNLGTDSKKGRAERLPETDGPAPAPSGPSLLTGEEGMTWAEYSQARASEIKTQIDQLNGTAGADKVEIAKLEAEKKAYENAGDYRRTQELKQEFSNKHQTELLDRVQNRERIDGKNIEWEPSQKSLDVRREVQNFTKAFMAGEYEKAYELARNSKTTPKHETSYKQVKVKASDLLSAPADHNSSLKNHIKEMERTGKAHIEPYESLEAKTYSVKEPQTIVELGSGAEVDLMDRSGNTYTKEGLTRRELTPQEKAEIQMVRDSDAGKKLFAEHAIQAFEERLVHLNQFPERQILSPTYARFVEQHATNSPSDDLFNLGIGRENKGLDDVKGTGRSLRTIEQEVPMLLYDAGMPVEMISQQMEKNHPYRKEVLDFLREQQAHETPASGSDAT